METQTIEILDKEKKSKNTLSVRSSRKMITNNIKDKRFQANIVAYKLKEEKILKNFMKLIEIHQECIQSSKHTALSQTTDIEDIELVVINYIIK